MLAYTTKFLAEKHTIDDPSCEIPRAKAVQSQQSRAVTNAANTSRWSNS